MKTKFKEIGFTMKEAKDFMRDVAKKENVELVFLTKDDGHGGYNYGGSAGNIMLAPFRKGKTGERDRSKKYPLVRDCDNPVECMLVAFFHELAHVRLTDKVPSIVKGYSWNNTSRFQFETWITMLGVEYAHSKYGLKFSDQSFMWMLNENSSYMETDWKRDRAALVQKRATSTSYITAVQWEFDGVHAGEIEFKEEVKAEKGGRKRGAKKGGMA